MGEMTRDPRIVVGSRWEFNNDGPQTVTEVLQGRCPRHEDYGAHVHFGDYFMTAIESLLSPRCTYLGGPTPEAPRDVPWAVGQRRRGKISGHSYEEPTFVVREPGSACHRVCCEPCSKEFFYHTSWPSELLSPSPVEPEAPAGSWVTHGEHGEVCSVGRQCQKYLEHYRHLAPAAHDPRKPTETAPVKGEAPKARPVYNGSTERCVKCLSLKAPISTGHVVNERGEIISCRWCEKCDTARERLYERTPPGCWGPWKPEYGHAGMGVTDGDGQGYDAREETPDSVAGCRLGCECKLHGPPKPAPWYPSVDDFDLLPDAGTSYRSPR